MRRRNNISLLLEILDQAYEKRAWHGSNLRGSIRGVTAAEAVRRPGAGRHNIRELVLHSAYWKYAVRRRLLGERRGSFPLKGSNWFPRPLEGGAQAWRADVALLDEVHRSLRSAVAAMDPGRLDARPAGSIHTTAQLVYGVASHDLYHAGQIQLIKRLMRG